MRKSYSGLLLLALATQVVLAAPVGRVPASFAVNPQGQAGYSIPIKVPAGTNGLAPKL